MPVTIRTLMLRIKDKHASVLSAMAREVNTEKPQKLPSPTGSQPSLSAS